MSEVKERHSRNIPSVSAEDMERIARSRVLVAGCGGLGGNIIEHLARMGVGTIIAADGDVFEESNLNRQVLSLPGNLGSRKAAAAADRVRAIDPSINVTAVCEYITKENAPALLADADLVMDALDNAGARLMLEDAAEEAGVTIIHGAIRGWDLQVMSVPPGSGLLHEIYGDSYEPDSKTSLPVTPAACAALQAALAIQCLCGHGSAMDGKILTGSLEDMRFDAVDLTAGDE